jgi:hypothetical protein
MSSLRIGLAGLMALALSACGSGGTDAGGASASAEGLVIETIRTDAAAVQAAAPPTAGKTDPGSPSGLLGYIEGSTPTRLVVFCHGLGQTVEDAWIEHVRRTVTPDVAVVTTNYRDNLQFPILRGAHDTIAATLMAKARFPSVETVYLLGVSMGGAVSGTAIAESVHVTEDGAGLYDYWVNVEGLVNQFEAWTLASAALPAVANDLAEDAGGTPAEVPEEYARRSPLFRVADLAATRLRAVAMVHAFNDGLVTYNQSREMAAAQLGVALPTQVFNVLRHAQGQDPGTTGTGFFGSLLGTGDPNDAVGLAGHGFEGDPNHPVIRTGFEQLALMLAGDYDETTPYRETLVDDGGTP